MKGFYVTPKARDYSVAYNNHEEAYDLYRIVMPIIFFVRGSDGFNNYHELYISTISVENRGVLTGAHTSEGIAAVNMFNNGPPTNILLGRLSSFYAEVQLAYTDVIHTVRVRNNTINAVAEYSFKSKTRSLTNGGGGLLYYTHLGVTSSLSLHITRIQRLEDGAKLGALWYCLNKKYSSFFFNNDVRALVRAYVDVHAFKDLVHNFEFQTGTGQALGTLAITPVAGFF